MTPAVLVSEWLDQGNGSHPSLDVQGLSPEEARQILGQHNPLFTIEVPSGTFEEVGRVLRPFTETLVDRLIRIDDLIISDDLQDILDRGLYNPRLSDLFEKLWSARFQHIETRNAQAIRDELLKETFEECSVALRCDALLFWFTLMGQNYPVSPGQLNLIVHGIADDELTLFLLMSEAWTLLGCPLRSLILS